MVKWVQSPRQDVKSLVWAERSTPDSSAFDGLQATKRGQMQCNSLSKMPLGGGWITYTSKSPKRCHELLDEQAENLERRQKAAALDPNSTFVKKAVDFFKVYSGCNSSHREFITEWYSKKFSCTDGEQQRDGEANDPSCVDYETALWDCQQRPSYCNSLHSAARNPIALTPNLKGLGLDVVRRPCCKVKIEMQTHSNSFVPWGQSYIM